MTIACVSLSILISIGLPLFLLWRGKKAGAKLVTAFLGALTFVLFALGLEPLLHRAVLKSGGFIATRKAAFIAYGALAAGLAEETGRLLAFLLLKKTSPEPTEKRDALMLGVGHGGIESILLAGIPLIALLVSLLSSGQSIPLAPAATYLLGGYERLLAILLHLSLSVLVLHSLTRPWYFPLAIILHAGVDAVAMLYRTGVVTSLLLTEAAVTVMTLAIFFHARYIYRKS